jgi:uncharacterized protein (TIGR02145 family)
MDHPLSPRFPGPGVVLASLLSLFSASSVPAQTLSGLTARQSGTAIILELASLASVDIDALTFFYSEDGGSHWQSIDPDCLTPASSRSVEWAVLECLDVDAFTGDNIRFKATSSSCTGTVRFDGYDYRIVEIGSQCWFAENLRSAHYANGDPIPGSLTDSEWTSTTAGAQAIYGEGSSTCDGNCDEVANLEAYGRLYNWYAVDDPRSLCPSGWHVPTDGEWMALTAYLGGSSVAGAAMKSSPEDSPSWNGKNTSGFSTLPGGLRFDEPGGFYFEGENGYWWGASPSRTPLAWFRELSSGSGAVDRYSYTLSYGYSVRCVRDE